MFTKDEVAKRSYEKAEKFRRDQAAQLRYAAEEGREEGLKEGIKAMITTLKELNVDKKTTIDKIMTRFNLKLNVAQGYVEANW